MEAAGCSYPIYLCSKDGENIASIVTTLTFILRYRYIQYRQRSVKLLLNVPEEQHLGPEAESMCLEQEGFVSLVQKELDSCLNDRYVGMKGSTANFLPVSNTVRSIFLCSSPLRHLCI